jgi:hypothetical protein
MNSLNNLIKSLMLAMVILGGTSFSMADPLPGDDPIIFELGRHDTTIAHGDYPRNPINPPSAYLDDHTLYINGEHPAYTLYLVDTPGSTTILRNGGVINMAAGNTFKAPIGAIVNIESGEIN